ncbi:MAG TPA: glycerol-3-phosphate dehydrogenase/oxidase, partial [Microthrixaceae bacterium]|nr:glycerol-3-phosphate dehydrogenase/oxidase [Microthrixaceae bacterium]
RLDKEATLAYMPTLPASRLVSSYLYFDAAADDARLVLTLVRSAALDHGAVIANRVAAKGLEKDSGGRITAVNVEADGETFLIKTRSVVNAAGVWSDDVRAQDEGTHPDSIRPAKGIHISVPWTLVRNEIAAVIPVPKDRRSVFVVPQGDLTYIGTTDTDYTGSIDDPQCTPEDIAYLLKAINGSCTNEIRTSDIVGSWAGLRPLVKAASSGRTADLSRKHKVARSRSGLVTITGGKLTTYREMAADTVDEVVKTVLPQHGEASGIGRSRTKNLRLRGAIGFDTLSSARSVYPAVTEELTEHLGNRYGGEARVLMAAIQKDPSLAEPLVSDLPYVKAEAIFAVRHEMAESVDDVLSRRTRARIFGRDDSADAADAVAKIIGEELGWSEAQCEASAAEYKASIEHERLSAELPVTHLGGLIDS